MSKNKVKTPSENKLSGRTWFNLCLFGLVGQIAWNLENMYYNTGLSRHQQLVACKELENYGIIKVKYHGMPKKRYFKFEPAAFNKLYNDFELNSNTADYESAALNKEFQVSF